MVRPRKTVRRSRKPKSHLPPLYLRYFTPLRSGLRHDNTSLVQPSPLQEVPSYASNGVRQPDPAR